MKLPALHRAPPRSTIERLLRNDRGTVLEPTVVIAVAMLIMILAVFQFGALDAGLVAHATSRSQALYLAEGGVARGVGWLSSHEDPPEGYVEMHPYGEDPIPCAEGTYTIKIVPDPTNGSSWRHTYTVVSESSVRGRRRRIEVDIQSEVFSDFLYFTDSERMPGVGGPLWFCSADVIDGPMFTNDQVSIFGDPTFKSIVQSAYGGPGDSNVNHNPAFLYYNGSATNHIESAEPHNAPHDNPTFEDNYSLAAPWIDYPALPDVFEMKTLARQGGVSLAGNFDFFLSRVDETGAPMYGYVSYVGPSGSWVDVNIADTNGVVFVNGGLTVQGVLEGQLTLATNGQIEILDDVVYRESSETGPLPHCSDVLGLIAGSDIVVGDTAPNQDDCVIHATMVALDNSFSVANWNTGAPRGDLTVWGSIIQSFRGSVGTGVLVEDEIHVITGFAKDYHYDWRLQDIYPPGFYRFLRTGQYSRLAWREILLS